MSGEERARFWLKEFRAQAAAHLEDYWRHSDDQEKIVLTALALLERQGRAAGGTFNLNQLQELYNRSERTVAHLEKRGLVVTRADGNALFNSTFGDWIVQEIAARQNAARRADRKSAPSEGLIQNVIGVPDATVSITLSSPKTPPTTSTPAGLTTRELEVLRLVASGLTDAQVAEKLVLSPRTVSTHLTSIYSKLGVNSRTAATRFAVEHGLI
jgi:DNA-binding CsgD family transcriptional regulator